MLITWGVSFNSVHCTPRSLGSQGSSSRATHIPEKSGLPFAVFGAEASNLALKTMATGGLFLAGGISPKILAKLKGPSFMRSFLDKGRMRALVEAMPVHVVTNEKVGLLGAARCGALRARG